MIPEVVGRVILGSGSAQHRSKPSSNLNIAYRPSDELKAGPANPRRHSKKQIRQIANSIEAFGFNVPILIDHDGNIIAGHDRWLACRLLGWSEVPTLCFDHLSPAQARAFMIADNRLAEIADWDDRLLAQQLNKLLLLVLDFNIELTGFEMREIDLRIASLDDPPRAPTIRQIWCRNCRAVRRSAGSAICGSLVAIGCCAAALSNARLSRR